MSRNLARAPEANAFHTLLKQADEAGVRLTPGMAEGLARGNPRMIAYVADLIAVRGRRPAIEPREEGGPLEPGKTYTINEKKPEAVVGADGSIRTMNGGKAAAFTANAPGYVLPHAVEAARVNQATQPVSAYPAGGNRNGAVMGKGNNEPALLGRSSSLGDSNAKDQGQGVGYGAGAAAAPPPGYSKGVLDLAVQMREPLHQWSEYFNRRRYHPEWPSSYEKVLATPSVLFAPIAEENEGDWQQHIVDNIQNVLVHHPAINGVVGASMEADMNAKLPKSLPWVGGKSVWELAGGLFNKGNGQGKPFQWDAGVGDFNMGTLDKLWAANSQDFEKAGFAHSGASDRPAQLQAWAAKPNGAAFVTALLFDKFREEYVPHMRGATEAELAQAFSSYYRNGSENFGKLYKDRIEKTVGQTDHQAAATILRQPNAYKFTPETRPKGAIDNWGAKHEQLKSLFGISPTPQ